MSENNTNMSPQNTSPEVQVQRVYVKDLSFEAPRTPAVFTENWTPQLNFELNIKTQLLPPAADKNNQDTEHYEVILDLVIHVKNGDNVAFLMDVKQAGIFSVKGANPEQLDHILRSFCPQILYPYAREAVSDLAARGSFPQLLLAPVYFDGLYQKEKAERIRQEQEQAKEKAH